MLAIFLVLVEKIKGFFRYKKKRTFVARSVTKINPCGQCCDAPRAK